jgi:hypothetical protein
MDFLGEITVQQIVVMVVLGLIIGFGFRWLKEKRDRDAALAAVAPYSPIPIQPTPPPAPVIAPAVAPAQTQYPTYDPLTYASWEAIQHDRALEAATKDLTSIEMLKLRARAGVQIRLDQEMRVAQFMQAMREPWPSLAGGQIPNPPSPATTVNVNTPATSPVMAETPK